MYICILNENQITQMKDIFDRKIKIAIIFILVLCIIVFTISIIECIFTKSNIIMLWILLDLSALSSVCQLFKSIKRKN